MPTLRHHHNNYETEDLGPAVIETMARQMTLDRETAMGNLAILGFAPDHVFEPAVVTPVENKSTPVSSPAVRFKHQNDFSGRLEH